MWKEKLGNYLIDVSKYFLTGVFVASLVKDLEDVRWLIYALSGTVAAILLLKVQSAIKPDEGVVPLPLNSHLNPLPGSFASQ
jgi:hypothetical protein